MTYSFNEYLQEILRQLGQSLMTPVLVLLIALILVVLFCVGSVIVEAVVERRHFKADMPAAINAVEAAGLSDLNDTICATKLLWSQKAALLMVANNAGLPDDALFALAKSELAREESKYSRRVGWTDLLTKIAPMLGLMATLIPLGPGIVAMGRGDLETLSSSIGTAFDGTVAGLVAAVVCMVVSHLRRRWYARYRTSLESLMTTLLEKADTEREAGERLPVGFTTADLEPLRRRARDLATRASRGAAAGDGERDYLPADGADASAHAGGSASEKGCAA